MGRECIFIIINLLLLLILYLYHIDKKKLSDELTLLLIEKKVIEKNPNIDKMSDVEIVRWINKKYRIGIINAKKVCDSLDNENRSLNRMVTENSFTQKLYFKNKGDKSCLLYTSDAADDIALV